MSVTRHRYPAYKDSGVPWLGEIPAHWDVERLKYVARITGGGTPAMGRPEFWGGDVPWASPKDFVADRLSDTQDHITQEGLQNSTTHMVPEASVLVVVRSGILKHSLPVSLTLAPMAINQDVKALSPVRGLEARFLAAALRGLAGTVLVLCRRLGATVDSIDAERFADLSLPLPPLAEQVAIAAYLDRETGRIDALVTRYRRLIDLLREKRAALITHAVTRGLDPDVPLRDSGVPWLGDIPAHWVVKRLKFALSRNDGGVWGEEGAGDDDVVLRSTDMGVGGEWQIDSPARRRLSPSERREGRLAEGDLLVTKSSGSALHLGKTALVTKDVAALGCCFSNFMQRLRLAQGNAAKYFYYLLNAPLGREQMNYLGTTTTGLANLNAAVLGDLRFTVPPLSEQVAIAAYLDRETGRIDALVERIERLIERLGEYRSALITAAVTGQIDVRDGARPQRATQPTEVTHP